MSRLSDSLPFSDFSFKVLNGSSIKAVFDSSRIASSTSFNAFYSNENKKLMFLLEPVSRCFLFHDFCGVPFVEQLLSCSTSWSYITKLYSTRG